jgi:hypothetical protein
MPKAKQRADRSLSSTLPDATERHVDPERVAQRAYELYLSRGGGDGRDFEDWIVAEQELIRGRTSSTTER